LLSFAIGVHMRGRFGWRLKRNLLPTLFHSSDVQGVEPPLSKGLKKALMVCRVAVIQDCHYVDGNYKALRQIALLRKMIGQLGIEESRLRLQWICASCAEDFVKVVDKMTADIRVLGPRKDPQIPPELFTV
jgi:coenzyme F420-reducing hydrogenase delta subunit